MHELEIGYCPLRMDWKVGDVSIETKSDLDQTIAGVEADSGVEKSWIYAPEQQTMDMMSRKIFTRPYKARVFGLPTTHILRHSGTIDEEHIRFLIWCMGFFTGMRLTMDEAGFIDATPIKLWVLHDIVWLGDSLPHAIECADMYWHQHANNVQVSKGLAGVIHSYFLSQTPTLLDFERFIYLYIALDGCYRVCSLTVAGSFSRVPHAQRITQLCEHYGIGMLPQAVRDIVSCRNDVLHEGLFFGEPLGFQIYGGVHHHLHRGTILELTKLVSRLIVAILGLPATDYIQSRIDDRQRHGVRV